MALKSGNEFDFIIIGAGIVGLALAREILIRRPGIKLCVLERENRIAAHQSGNNSGVIHSGIYYKPGSQKALNCLAGYRLMLEYLRENNLPFEVCGKIIAAVAEDELPALRRLYQNGLDLGLDKIEWLNEEQCKTIQPGIKALSGIWVPYTAITDYKLVCESLVRDIRQLGGEIRFQIEVSQVLQNHDIAILTDRKKVSFFTRKAIVCAGLWAGQLAHTLTNQKGLTIIPFQGRYYDLKQAEKFPIGPLIYPVPNPAFPFLGVHWTRHLDGSISLGPNATPAMSLSNSGSRMDVLNFITKAAFWKMAWRYRKQGFTELMKSGSADFFAVQGSRFGWKIQSNDLKKGKMGIRALMVDQTGQVKDDFVIIHDSLITHVLNAPSPAATSSLSIARNLADEIL